MIVRFLISGIVLAIAAIAASAVSADCVRAIGAIPSLQGEAQVQAGAAGAWRPAALDERLCPGNLIHIGNRSRAELTIVNQPNVRLDQNTGLHLPDNDEPMLVRLLYGAAYFFSRYPRVLTINTPFVDAAVEGTEFLVRVEAYRTLIVVFAGTVRASNAQGELAIANGQSAVAEAGQAPTPYLIIRPRDAVQWTLFYPAILPALADPSGASAQALPEPLRAAVVLVAAGQLAAAFALFEAIPEADRGPDYYLHRAATLLSVGRVEEARADIDQALAVDPQNGPAYGLRAVVAVARNEDAPALEDAQRAVELSPQSAAAKIALSYAEQAQFRIGQAREALQQAVQDEPANALAWARLSELWLMQGRHDRARKAAKQARKLAPELARVQTVLGFAELAEIDTGRAKKAFRRAIAIDSANPLPRFGLGLATIRAGDLEKGRKDIEIAVALDPNNSLLRSYLGKAYFEERTTDPATYFEQLVTNFPNQENTLAAEQFTMAKELDPNDPTPWLYDAIRLQSENRPVEALRDIEKSIELNDNRAVYRSRELLDQDRAARGASLARIYNNLGFEQLGVNEATKSLSYDPSNAGAHRFLSDVYATQPRREIARTSQLLQAQLMQDININPVQPSRSETNLNIITGGGPARPGFNEFTPLFERNQAQLNVSGLVGNEGALGDEAVVSGIYDNVSVSAGQLHYQSNGFRKNFDVQNDVYDLYAQAAVTPKLNVQAEFRTRRSEEGDLQLNFDPKKFIPDLDRDLVQDTGRLGLRFSPSPASNVLASLIYTGQHAKLQESGVPVSFGTITEDMRTEQSALQAETQYLLRHDTFNIVAGANFYNVDTHSKNAFLFNSLMPGINFASELFDEKFHTQQETGYLYSNLELPRNITWTLGFSYDDYQELKTNIKDANPKLGLEWELTNNLRLRLAAFRTVKPTLIASQTIQPTEIAGFNQFFDDVNGTQSTAYGLGLDAHLTKSLYLGAEISARDLDMPISNTGKSIGQDEDLYRLYLYWAPNSEWAVSGEARLDKYHSDEPVQFVPKQLDTFSIPLTLRYFSPSGFFGGIGGTYVYQHVTPAGGQTDVPKGDSSFVVLDAAVGYRLPRRLGIISLGARNILNQHFNYKDDSFREIRSQHPQISPYIPERIILAQLFLSF